MGAEPEPVMERGAQQRAWGGGDPLTPQDVYVSGCAIAIPKWQGWAVAAKARLEALLGRDLERAVS